MKDIIVIYGVIEHLSVRLEPDAVKAARYLISAVSEFSARVKNGKDDLQRGFSRLCLDIHGDSAPVVAHPDYISVFYYDLYCVAVACQRLVYGVVNYLIYEMVQTRGRGRPDIHSRTFSYSLQAFQHLDLRSVIFLCYFFCKFCHVSFSWSNRTQYGFCIALAQNNFRAFIFIA